MTRLRRHGPWLAALIAFAVVVTWWWHRPLPEPGTLAPPRYLLPIRVDGKVGAIDRDGNVVVPAIYESIRFVGATTVSDKGVYVASVYAFVSFMESYVGDNPTAWMRAERTVERWQMQASWPFTRRITETRFDMLDSQGQIVLMGIRDDGVAPVIQQYADPPRNYLVHEDGRLTPIPPLRDPITSVALDGTIVTRVEIDSQSDEYSISNYIRCRLHAPDGQVVLQRDGIGACAPGFYSSIEIEDGSSSRWGIQSVTLSFVSAEGEILPDIQIRGLSDGWYYRVKPGNKVELHNRTTGASLLLDDEPAMTGHEQPQLRGGHNASYLWIYMADRLTVFDTHLRTIYVGDEGTKLGYFGFNLIPNRPHLIHRDTEYGTQEIDITTGKKRDLLGVEIRRRLNRAWVTTDGESLWGLQDDDGHWVVDPIYTTLIWRGSDRCFIVRKSGERESGVLAPDGTLLLATGKRTFDRAIVTKTGDSYRLFTSRREGDQIWINDDPGRRPVRLEDSEREQIMSYGAFDVIRFDFEASSAEDNDYWIYDHAKQDWWPNGYWDIKYICDGVLRVQTADGEFGYRRPDGSWIWRSDPGME